MRRGEGRAASSLIRCLLAYYALLVLLIVLVGVAGFAGVTVAAGSADRVISSIQRRHPTARLSWR